MGRRKGNSAFPVARIKKMMQADDDVGKIATVTPVLVAKALECMMEHVLTEAADVARRRCTKTVTPQHLKHCVANNDHFDFLRPTLAHITPLQDQPGLRASSAPPRRTRPKRPRSPLAPAASSAAARPREHPSSSDAAMPPLPHIKSASGARAAAKRHKVPSHAPAVSAPAVSAPQLSTIAHPATNTLDPAADEDDDNYDDDDDDDDQAPDPSESQSVPSLPPPHSIPAVQHPALSDKDDSKASERVSVHALLS